jgi:hypothetical protein
MTPNNGADDGQRDGSDARVTRKRTVPVVAGEPAGRRGTVGCDRMDKLILGFLGGDLETETRERVVEHLENCDACYGKMLAIQYGMERRRNPELMR